LRKSFLVAGMATLALGTGTAGVASAQDVPAPSIEATGSGSPSKAGTKKKPKGVTFKLNVQNAPESKTTAKSVKITFPSTIKVSTKGLNQCKASEDELIADKTICKKAYAGKGSAVAFVNPFATNPARLDFTIQPIVAKNEVLFVLNSNIANAVLHGKIKGRSMTIEISPELQQPAPGTFSALSEIIATIKAKKGKNHLISSTGCKGGKHKIDVEVAYVPNPTPPVASTAKDSFDIKCSK
jgi:hypothetical protein